MKWKWQLLVRLICKKENGEAKDKGGKVWMMYYVKLYEIQLFVVLKVDLVQ